MLQGLNTLRGPQAILPAAPITARMRPLGPLSDFVCEQLPKLNSKALNDPEVREVLGTEAEHASDAGNLELEIRRLISEGSKQGSTVALLDLSMLVRSLSHFDLPVPTQISGSQARLAEFLGTKACLTYEQIVRYNPIKDTRTFTSGEVGRAERYFYLDHERVERALVPVVHQVRQGLGLLLAAEIPHSLDQALLGRAAQHIERAHSEFQRVLTRTARFEGQRKITPELFAGFREFLTKNEGHPGPSGLFSPGQHMLRTLVFGAGVRDRLTLIEKMIDFFPTESQAELVRAVRAARQGESLGELAARRAPYPPRLHTAIHRLLAEVAGDMERHLQMVRAFLGSASGVVGTAGYSGGFLGGGVIQAQAMVKKIGPSGTHFEDPDASLK